MTGAVEELTIRSRHGALRDLLPVYKPLHLAMTAGVLALAFWLGWVSGWHLPPVLLLFAALQWNSLFEMRPSVLTLPSAQAAQVEAAMIEEGFFIESVIEGRWELNKGSGWSGSDVMELVRTDHAVMVRAPRHWLEAIRAYLEWIEQGEEARGIGAGHPFQIGGEEEEIPWHAKAPAFGLSAVMAPLLLYDLFARQVGHWGVSGTALAEGRYETIPLHMISHGSFMHVAMNIAALLAIGTRLMLRLGRPPLSWLRFMGLFMASGLAGATMFVLLHPLGQVPMVGASGAIYGLIGLLIRLPHRGEELLSLRSRTVRRHGVAMIKENVFLFALLGLMAWGSGSAGGLAWEAHLGGFLFGFFAGPKFLPRAWAPALAEAEAG